LSAGRRTIEVNCLGDMCPAPVIKTKIALKRASPGDVVLITTDHSCTMKSLPELLKKMGYSSEVEEVDTGVWQIRIPVPGG